MASKKEKNGCVVSVVGIIGLVAAGKSTLVEKCSKISGLTTVKECVEDYTTFQDHDPLELLYSNPVKNVPIAQMHFISCINRYISHFTDSKLLVTDRTLYCPLVFTETHYKEGTISLFARDYLLTETNKAACDTKQKLNLEYKGIFYIDTPPAICQKRIAERKRACEQKIPLQYLIDLEIEYMSHLEIWRKSLGEDRVVVVSGTQSAEVIFDEFCDFLNNIAVI